VNKQLTFIVVFGVVAALLATSTSSGQGGGGGGFQGAAPVKPATGPAPAMPSLVPGEPAQGQVQFGGGGGGRVGRGGVAVGGFFGGAAAQPAIVFDQRTGAVMQYFDGNAVNAPLSQNPKAIEITQVVHDLRTTEDPAEKADLKMRLENAVTDYFDDDMKTRETELANLEERVKKLRSQLDRRSAAKAEIVQLQVKVLTNDAEGLGFNNLSDSTPETNPVVPQAVYSTPATGRRGGNLGLSAPAAAQLRQQQQAAADKAAAAADAKAAEGRAGGAQAAPAVPQPPR
jgi:hypothetical protein